MKTRQDKQMLDAMRKNPDNWKGIFYYNRQDPRLVVPKLYPYFGYTLNFASGYVYVFLALLILIVLASEFLF
ncbi:DUF5808 domain-containing protein [Geofilum rubicundum]|uniref:DUF5808 domain-containing protein n=1 Tax=Geofilum rubicundum JCM 15548 TaxID=1236989 RepID=A0A0E9LRG4_9BACT|nr:DUF5808 domain-containing protein [Geofilum rubicundum]GAO27741.1 hypothetical protein JCM15548_14591 [Geofilum rubicundum JCM 15548]